MRFTFSSLTILSTVATAVVAGPLVDGQLGSLDSHLLRSLESLNSIDVESFDLADMMHDFDERAADDCAGVSLRARTGLNGADVGPRDCSIAAGPESSTGSNRPPGNGLGSFYAYNRAPERITATSDPKTAKVKQVSNNGPQRETNIYGRKTCDHVLELNVLKTILNQGACDAAKAMTEDATYTGKDPTGNTVSLDVTEGQKRILEIREIVMRPRNLVSLQGRIEELKTQTMHRFSGLGASAVGQDRPLDYLAMADYTLQKTVTWSLETAAMLDAAIAQRFPGAPIGVENRWIVFLAFVRKQAQDRLKQIENEKRRAQCSAAPATPATPAGGKTKRAGTFSGAFTLETRVLDEAIKARGLEGIVAKFERKSKTTALGFTPFHKSSLESRAAKSTRRSGPKSPSGPSCPAKNQPQKKQIKKSAAKMKPKPAKKPRRPAQRPAPRQPARKKQVAKRPANRPRRTPGKQVPRKRTTPRRKPKSVPKPTRRPKGKARPRRRRK